MSQVKPIEEEKEMTHRNTRHIMRKEAGAALVVALFMIVILSLIGLASSSSSIFEIGLSGNKRGSTTAFYAADGGAQAAMTNVQNFNLTRYDSDDNKYEDVLNDPANTNQNPTNATVVITHETSLSGPPRGLGMGTHVSFIHFLITSTGQDQMESSLIRSTCAVDQKVLRVIPSPD